MFMDFQTLVFIFVSIFSICTFIVPLASRSSKLPPGPFRFPIIGNILDLGSKPHQSLAKLSKKYGPLMSLKLGSRTAIVVSSPELAKVMLQKHDIAFSNRPVPSTMRYIKHEKLSIAWLPVGSQWRKLRKVSREKLFSNPKMDASQGLRLEKLQKLFGYLKECSKVGRSVDIGAAAFTTTVNLMSASLFSVEFAQSYSSREMKDLVWEIMIGLGRPNVADFFPILEYIDPQGISRRFKIYWDKLFNIFDGIIEERLESKSQTNDLLQTLIHDSELSKEEIKHLLPDLFIAGTDTSTSTVEWAMTELLRYPDKLSTLRHEIKGVIDEKGQVEESDIARLPYLEAVVKETLRLHPPGPFLLPHMADSEVEINGYVVPKNAQILINVWAMGRDNNVWPDAELFMPERFLIGKYDQTDFRGKYFELIPFGSGRRICPGLPLADRMVHLMIAVFAGHFEWKLDGGIKPEELDMEEKASQTIQKDIPLKAIPMLLHE